MLDFDRIIKESISTYLQESLVNEKEDKSGNTKKKGFRKKALKKKGGERKDFNVEDEKTYNQNVDDQEQASIVNELPTDYVNVKKFAEELYPDHTPEGAQSQLRKKLKGEKSDSGSTYKLKKKEVKKLRHLIAKHLK